MFKCGREDFALNALGMLLQAPDRANLLRDETLPADIYMQAEFSSMCGSKHCLMQTKITDEDLEGLEKVLEAKGGAEVAGVKMDKAD